MWMDPAAAEQGPEAFATSMPDADARAWPPPSTFRDDIGACSWTPKSRRSAIAGGWPTTRWWSRMVCVNQGAGTSSRSMSGRGRDPGVLDRLRARLG